MLNFADAPHIHVLYMCLTLMHCQLHKHVHVHRLSFKSAEVMQKVCVICNQHFCNLSVVRAIQVVMDCKLHT